MATQAPFETFREHAIREQSDEPYSEDFIQRCREKALGYDKLERILRVPLLQDLKKCIPMHYRARVFDGITNFEARR